MIYLDVAFMLLALGILALVVYGPLQAYCIDAARDEMFRARDAMFMLAARGELSFDDPSYRQIRDSLNKLIRFAHHITWHRLLLFKLMTLRRRKDEPDLSRALNNLRDDGVREAARMNVQLAANAAGWLLVMRSPLLWLLMPAVFLSDQLAWLGAKHDALVKRTFLTIQSDAEQSDKSHASETRVIRAGT